MKKGRRGIRTVSVEPRLQHINNGPPDTHKHTHTHACMRSCTCTHTKQQARAACSRRAPVSSRRIQVYPQDSHLPGYRLPLAAQLLNLVLWPGARRRAAQHVDGG